MKLKEKLAEELFEKYRATQATKEAFIEIYLAAFEKAREMAENVSIRYLQSGDIYQHISELGEEEVE